MTHSGPEVLFQDLRRDEIRGWWWWWWWWWYARTRPIRGRWSTQLCSCSHEGMWYCLPFSLPVPTLWSLLLPTIPDTDSVLYTTEDHAILQSLSNTTIVRLWKFRL